ncbi:MAG: hypothetical protein Q9216_001094 [Gyalolechia sp. 2 TL-2023]
MVQVDPPSLPEPRVPSNSHPPYLRIVDKSLIDEEYFSFPTVWQRLWPRFLRDRLERFCRSRRDSPSIFHKELLYAEVDRLLGKWIDGAVFTKEMWNRRMMRCGWPAEALVRPYWEQEWRARVEYERRVRAWHVGEHGAKYRVRAAGELRRMGYRIGL